MIREAICAHCGQVRTEHASFTLSCVTMQGVLLTTNFTPKHKLFCMCDDCERERRDNAEAAASVHENVNDTTLD